MYDKSPTFIQVDQWNLERVEYDSPDRKQFCRCREQVYQLSKYNIYKSSETKTVLYPEWIDKWDKL